MTDETLSPPRRVDRPPGVPVRGRAFLNPLCFAGGIVLAAWLLRPVHEPEPNYTAKMALFAIHRPVVEVISVGASYLESSFEPAVFEERTGFRSFNFGLPGFRGYRMELLVRELLKDPPPRLKYLLLDLGEWPSGFEVWEYRHAAFSHSPEITLAAVKWSLSRGDPKGVKGHLRKDRRLTTGGEQGRGGGSVIC